MACMAFAAPTPARFRVDLPQGSQEVTSQPRVLMGEGYVPIRPLLAPLGATLDAYEAGFRIQLGPARTWVQGGNRHVEGTRGWFQLGQPWRVVEGELHMAVDDVEVLFRRAFGTAVRVLDQGAPAVARTAENEGVAVAPAQDPGPSLQPFPMPDDNRSEEEETSPAPRFDEMEPRLQPVPDEPAAPDPFLVVVDPGHGGGDSGVVGDNGLPEKEVTLAIALELHSLFENNDRIAIGLTREDDTELTTSQRGAMMQRYGGDLFLSIHTGAGLASDMTGHVLYFPRYESTPPLGERGGTAERALARQRVNQSEQWAALMSEGLERETGDTVRRAAPLRCRVMRHLDAPSVMAEIGVLTDGGGERDLSTGSYLRRVAEGLAESIRAYHEAVAE
ncbi:MAG: N-acetylmuramoyl-L-alanine amidase [Candidatus Hydrogenedentota bacterium]